MRFVRIMGLLSPLALAACSSGGGGGSGINVSDACAALPRDVVQQAIGRPIQSAELKDVTADGGTGMASSACVYDFGEARLVQLHLQRYPSGVDAGTSLTGMRDMYKESGTAMEEVPGVGRLALYVASGNSQQLHVQVDGSHTALVSMFRLDSIADPKAKLIELARRVTG